MSIPFARQSRDPSRGAGWGSLVYLNLMFSLVQLLIGPLLIGLALSGCTSSLPNSSKEQIILARLTGRGPVLVSEQNPYLAATAFLNHEKQSSPELATFLKERGYPKKLQHRSSPLSDAELMLFYDDSAAPIRATLSDGQWRFGAVGQVARASLSPSPPQIPKQAHLQQRLESCRRTHQYSVAEQTPRGDLVHFVSSGDGESVELIALWYTGVKATAETILRVNQLQSYQANTALAIGQEIVIPRALLRYRVRLGEEALNCLRN